ncbi:MAG TPA: hypothetical protein VKK61_06255 [Tepidisphaeraceae bacterium]|nr:hypothetical protein [Tepidisphaeraceae bacterium]
MHAGDADVIALASLDPMLDLSNRHGHVYSADFNAQHIAALDVAHHVVEYCRRQLRYRTRLHADNARSPQTSSLLHLASNAPSASARFTRALLPIFIGTIQREVKMRI